ncbi:MAG: DUF1800 domain-containing protein [Phycisphaerales bacterium]|nr:DUF1800 domain-containing protein [Hyphomonadaceae bacterium]
MTDMRTAAIAANRFGFGARPGDLRAIAGDPRGWIKAQFAPQASMPAPIAALPPGEDDLLAFGRWIAARRLRRGNAEGIERQAERQGVSDEELRMLSTEEDFIATFRSRAVTAIGARIEAAITSSAPARERAVHFWSNHFTVSAAKPAAIALPPSFEREAIRPHVAGNFTDMLAASTQHPGMLIYLDNWLSVGPNSVAVQRRARRAHGQGQLTGINENLAREILELHTLGVGGGYGQADVQSLAAILTGWTYDRPRLIDYVREARGERSGASLFEFDAPAHEPGAHMLLGRVYLEGGVAQGERALADLAQHPSTARFIATKLTRHYIADDPPPTAVARVAAAYARSDGDLRATMDAVVDCDEAWADPFAKFKRPEEYAISALRAANIQTLPVGAGAAAIGAMGQRVYAAPGPDGWSDRAESWLSADLVYKRIEFAQTYGERTARADIDARQIGEDALGPLFSADTRQAVQRAESPAQALTLLFASPEFQRR